MLDIAFLEIYKEGIEICYTNSFKQYLLFYICGLDNRLQKIDFFHRY